MRDIFLLTTHGETLNVKTSQPRALLSTVVIGDAGAIFLGRLHYVADLKRRLPSLAGQSLTSPAAIALAAYRAHGASALEHLEGEFALVLWNRTTREVLAMRDPLGGYPLFWAERAGDIAVGCTMGPLCEFLGTATPNAGYFADYLTRPTLALDEPFSEETSMSGVKRVLPGTIVTFRYPGATVKRRQYWRWQDLVVDPGSDQTDAIAEQVRALLDDAVRERTFGNVAAHFSGGMDSTAIALLARNRMRPSSQGSLQALTLWYEAFETLKGERRFVDAALAGQSGITPHRVAADDLLAYDNFHTPPDLDEPFAGLLDFAKDRAMFAVASAAGVNCVLTGEGGDDVLDIPPFAIADMIRRGHLRSAWRESARWARAYAADPWQMFREFGLDPLLPAGLRKGFGALWRRGDADWSRRDGGTVAPWIRKDFALRHDLTGRTAAQSAAFFRSQPSVALSAALAGIQCRVGDRRRWTLASENGMALSHPFLDPRLLRLGLGIRMRYRQDPHIQKPLLAQAMRDVLPSEILNRRGKTHFNEVYYRGLARNRPFLERMIADARIDHLGIFDKGALTTCLRQSAMGVEFSAHGSMQLDLALSLVSYLSIPPRAARHDLLTIEQQGTTPARAA